MTKKMTKNAQYAKIDHILLSAYPGYSIRLVSLVLDRTDRMNRWTESTNQMRRILSESARNRGWWKETCAPENSTQVRIYSIEEPWHTSCYYPRHVQIFATSSRNQLQGR